MRYYTLLHDQFLSFYSVHSVQDSRGIIVTNCNFIQLYYTLYEYINTHWTDVSTSCSNIFFYNLQYINTMTYILHITEFMLLPIFIIIPYTKSKVLTLLFCHDRSPEIITILCVSLLFICLATRFVRSFDFNIACKRNEFRYCLVANWLISSIGRLFEKYNWQTTSITPHWCSMNYICVDQIDILRSISWFLGFEQGARCFAMIILNWIFPFNFPLSSWMWNPASAIRMISAYLPETTTMHPPTTMPVTILSCSICIIILLSHLIPFSFSTYCIYNIYNTHIHLIYSEWHSRVWLRALYKICKAWYQ